MKIFLIINLFIVSIFAKPASLTKEQKRQISICFESYRESIQLYSREKDANLRTKLGLLVSNPFRSQHFNDLYIFLGNDDVNLNSNNFISFANYLRVIDEKFPDQVNVEFGNINTIDCINDDIGLVSLDKKVTYKGITRNFSIIVLISLPKNENEGSGYKIFEVLSAEFYKGERKPCSEYIQVSKDVLELNQKQKDADDYFYEKKDFLTAQNLYQYVLSKKVDDAYLKKQIELCRKNINKLDYLNKADYYFDKKEFETSQYWYKKLLVEFPNDNDFKDIPGKIKRAEEGRIDQNYQNAISKADRAYINGDFNNARFYYEQALMIKNRDVYALNRFEESKIKDDKYAEAEIDRVVKLASVSSRYWGEYFKILMKYEGYGNRSRLTSKHYYNMVLLLNSYDSKVMSAMNFNRRDCRSYCKIYCKKLNDVYFYETNPVERDKIEHLLNNVINNNNQN